MLCFKALYTKFLACCTENLFPMPIIRVNQGIDLRSDHSWELFFDYKAVWTYTVKSADKRYKDEGGRGKGKNSSNK